MSILQEEACKTLTTEHRAELELSGLTSQTIEASGWYSESDQRKIRAILRRRELPVDLGPCLVIPYRNHDGTFSEYRRVKPSNLIGDGRKYESPVGLSNRAFFPPNTIPQLSSSSTIVITEGEKKALASDQAGIACIGLSGVWNWPKKRDKTKTPNDERFLIDDLNLSLIHI